MELFIIELSVESINITKFCCTSSQRKEREIEREERSANDGRKAAAGERGYKIEERGTCVAAEKKRLERS